MIMEIPSCPVMMDAIAGFSRLLITAILKLFISGEVALCSGDKFLPEIQGRAPRGRGWKTSVIQKDPP